MSENVITVPLDFLSYDGKTRINAKIWTSADFGTPEQPGTVKPKGVIPVDLVGQPADYDEIWEVAKEHDLFVLEDAAQGFGGVYNGKRAGSLGHVGATSFFPAKPLGCYGDGGAVFTNNECRWTITIQRKLIMATKIP